MKNVIFAALTLIVVAVFVSSCTKEQVVPSEPGMAMVTYMVGVNSDETNDTTATGSFRTTYEAVPAGTEVIFSINSADLQRNPNGNYTYETLTFRATTESNGMVNVELPAIGTDLDVDVRFPDLKISVKKEMNINGTMTIVMEEEIFTGSTETVSIYDGAQILREYEY